MAVRNVKRTGKKFSRTIQIVALGRPMYKRGSKKTSAWHVKWNRETSRFDAFTTAVAAYFRKMAMVNRTRMRPRKLDAIMAIDNGESQSRMSSSTLTHFLLSLVDA